ncbi:MAG: hypothetical protein R2749_18465 [Acidimicrobiales bacterium]
MVVEHGVVMAEVAGLEVGEVVRDPEGNGVHLEVGVGRHDREAAQIMEAVLSPQGVTPACSTSCAPTARPGTHPTCSPAWPASAGCARGSSPIPAWSAPSLEPLEPPLAAATSSSRCRRSPSGAPPPAGPLVVACAVGVDLEAVPTAADARDRFDPDAELVYAAPARDQYPVVAQLAAQLLAPARLVTVDGEWVD